MRSMRPGSSPSPLQGRTSSDSSNSICMPRQMPRKGFSFAASSTASVRPEACSASIASGNAPTPGRITPAACSITSGEAAILFS